MRKMPAEELANESRSTHITVATDMVFSLSHYLSGVRFDIQYCVPYFIGSFSDGYCWIRARSERRIMGRDPIVWVVRTSTAIQFAKASGDILLQYEPDSFRMVKPVGNHWGTLQSGS